MIEFWMTLLCAPSFDNSDDLLGANLEYYSEFSESMYGLLSQNDPEQQFGIAVYVS